MHHLPLYCLPTIVTRPGRYRTRGGAVVTVNKIDDAAAYSARGHHPNGVREAWHRSGRLLPNIPSPHDIIERIGD